jgi:hypothetical protein
LVSKSTSCASLSMSPTPSPAGFVFDCVLDMTLVRIQYEPKSFHLPVKCMPSFR